MCVCLCVGGSEDRIWWVQRGSVCKAIFLCFIFFFPALPRVSSALGHMNRTRSTFSLKHTTEDTGNQRAGQVCWRLHFLVSPPPPSFSLPPRPVESPAQGVGLPTTKLTRDSKQNFLTDGEKDAVLRDACPCCPPLTQTRRQPLNFHLNLKTKTQEVWTLNCKIMTSPDWIPST